MESSLSYRQFFSRIRWKQGMKMSIVSVFWRISSSFLWNHSCMNITYTKQMCKWSSLWYWWQECLFISLGSASGSKQSFVSSILLMNFYFYTFLWLCISRLVWFCTISKRNNLGTSKEKPGDTLSSQHRSPSLVAYTRLEFLCFVYILCKFATLLSTVS